MGSSTSNRPPGASTRWATSSTSGASRIARLRGTVSAWLNGRRWHANPRAIPLLPHADIQLQIGRPAAPLMQIDWSATQL
jgi:hypothetical protein